MVRQPVLDLGYRIIRVVLSVETPKDGVEVSTDVSGITDSTDGVASANFQYQWIRVDAAEETDIDGETGATYTPTADDVDKHLKVRVVFDDDAGNEEYPRTSPQFGPVVDAVPPIVSTANATVATTIYIIFSEPLDPASSPGRVGVHGPGGWGLPVRWTRSRSARLFTASMHSKAF